MKTRLLVNHLGCACILPKDLDVSFYRCTGCATIYRRNPIVFRWYVEWTPTTTAEVIAAAAGARDNA